MKRRIICIGNRYVDADAAGMLVFEKLQARTSSFAEVEIVEGGLAGLNLLPLLEEGGKVVFVDAVQGFAPPGEIVVLHWHDMLAIPTTDHFDHQAGLVYLLKALPHVCEGTLPQEITLIGLEGICPASVIDRAAELSLTTVSQGE